MAGKRNTVLTQGKKTYRVQITGIYSEQTALRYEGKYDEDDPDKPDGIDFGTTITINAF